MPGTAAVTSTTNPTDKDQHMTIRDDYCGCNVPACPVCDPTGLIPDRLPILTRGLGNAAAGKACAMSAVHWMEGGQGNSDAPECVHPVLSAAFVRINDAPIWTDDEHRTRTLWPLIVRAMGTNPTGTDHERKVLKVRLAVVAAKHVQHLVPDSAREASAAAIAAAEGWCDGRVTKANCRVAAVYASSSASSAASFAAAAAAASAAASASAASSASSAASSAASFSASSAAASAATDLLVVLLDEHERLTGHTAPAVDLRGLDQRVPTVTAVSA